MTSRRAALLMMMTPVLLVRCQAVTIDVDRILKLLDVNGDGNITGPEFDTLGKRWTDDGELERCRMTVLLADVFGVTGLGASALFDLQSTDGTNLNVDKLKTSLLGSSGQQTVVSVSVFQDNIRQLQTLLNTVIAAPYQSTSGPTAWKYTEFDIGRMADLADADHNGRLDRQEVTGFMRALDINHNGQIVRCEYIQAMMLYKQHSVTASIVYEHLFQSRDSTWADVDSDFFMSVMDKNGDSLTSKQEFITFFSAQNLLAAGLPVSYEGGTLYNSAGVISCNLLAFLVASGWVM